jgi:hypothetical protein
VAVVGKLVLKEKRDSYIHGKKQYKNTTQNIIKTQNTQHYLLIPWSRVLLEKLTVNFAASQNTQHREQKHKTRNKHKKNIKRHKPNNDKITKRSRK